MKRGERGAVPQGESEEPAGSSSIESFLRQVAHVPHVEPPVDGPAGTRDDRPAGRRDAQTDDRPDDRSDGRPDDSPDDTPDDHLDDHPDDNPEVRRIGQTLGRFQLTSLIGRGGMGVVYEAVDLALQRRVALKLLRAGAAASDERRRRFLREARAAAAVTHPNIATVFDVGEVGEVGEAGEANREVFIAMELVDGPDVRAWLAARSRSAREIIEVFTMAGRGLAAAHRAGLVHRDFKPDNVLLDATGRARVADFGLAVGAARLAAPAAPAASPAWTRGIETRLTRPGAVAGTPGYIAPELLGGREADARCDQYAFCVALFEALEGHRPYDQIAPHALAPGKSLAWRPRRTPLWLRGVLARGLSIDPGGRFPSMEALLTRVHRARIWPRRAAVLCVAAAALALWALAFRPQAPGCEALAAEVPAAWVSARADIRATFARAGVPYAADANDRVRLKLDEWTDRWAQARRTACEWPDSAATECLARRQDSFGAVLQLLRKADAQVVSRAATLVDGLADPAQCVASPGAQAPAAAPDRPDLEDLEHTEDGAGVRQRIAEGRALLAAGKYREALALGRAVARDAAGVPALEADALAVTAVAAWKGGDSDAEQALLQARWAAERARLDSLSVELALWLSEVFGQRRDFARSEEWLGHAEATLARVGKDLRLESMVLAGRAQLEGLRDQRVAASELALRALSMREQALGKDHLEVSESLLLAAGLMSFDQIGMATTFARRALDIRVAVLGSDHPDVAMAWDRLGQAYRDQYDHARELEAQQHGLRIRLAALGPDHPDVARSRWNEGVARMHLGQDAAARDGYQAARDILVRIHGPDWVRAAVADLNIAEIEAELGDVEKGLAIAREALARIDRGLGPDSASSSQAISIVADLLVRHGDLDEADRLYTRAMVNGERRDPGNSKLRFPLAGRSSVARLRGQIELARTAAARAIEVGLSEFPADYPELLPAYQAHFRAALQAGDLEEARRQAARAQAVADRWLASDHPLAIDVQQVQALLAAATGDRASAIALARAALGAQEARPWQVLRGAEARVVLACALGKGNAEAARLLREAVAALRGARAFGSADAALARCR